MTWLALWHPALLVLAGLLCGGYLHHRHLDQVKRDAWEDGFHASLDSLGSLGINMDEPSRQLDAAATQTRPDPAYPRWWN